MRTHRLYEPYADLQRSRARTPNVSRGNTHNGTMAGSPETPASASSPPNLRLKPENASTGLVDAAAVAVFLGTSRDYVYEHAAELGARRLGAGPKPRLRFNLSEIEAALSCSTGRESVQPSTPVAEPLSRRRRPQALGTGVELLPIRGSLSGRAA
jgi:hypothetical protein